MKYIIILLTAVLFLTSCSSSKNGCVTPRDVQRFDSNPFRAINWPNYERSTLVKITRTMRGQTHYFITDNGDTIRKILGKRLAVGQCYMIRKDS